MNKPIIKPQPTPRIIDITPKSDRPTRRSADGGVVDRWSVLAMIGLAGFLPALSIGMLPAGAYLVMWGLGSYVLTRN